jgi:hypothetical protein
MTGQHRHPRRDDDEPFDPVADQTVEPGFFDSAMTTLVAHDSPDTYERAVDEAGGGPLNDLVWLAAHGNATAALVADALNRQLADEIVAECWPGASGPPLRADIAVRLSREVARRRNTSTERHAWRWN